MDEDEKAKIDGLTEELMEKALERKVTVSFNDTTVVLEADDWDVPPASSDSGISDAAANEQKSGSHPPANSSLTNKSVVLSSSHPKMLDSISPLNMASSKSEEVLIGTTEAVLNKCIPSLIISKSSGDKENKAHSSSSSERKRRTPTPKPSFTDRFATSFAELDSDFFLDADFDLHQDQPRPSNKLLNNRGADFVLISPASPTISPESSESDLELRKIDNERSRSRSSSGIYHDNIYHILAPLMENSEKTQHLLTMLMQYLSPNSHLSPVPNEHHNNRRVIETSEETFSENECSHLISLIIQFVSQMYEYYQNTIEDKVPNSFHTFVSNTLNEVVPDFTNLEPNSEKVFINKTSSIYCQTKKSQNQETSDETKTINGSYYNSQQCRHGSPILSSFEIKHPRFNSRLTSINDNQSSANNLNPNKVSSIINNDADNNSDSHLTFDNPAYSYSKKSDSMNSKCSNCFTLQNLQWSAEFYELAREIVPLLSHLLKIEEKILSFKYPKKVNLADSKLQDLNLLPHEIVTSIKKNLELVKCLIQLFEASVNCLSSSQTLTNNYDDVKKKLLKSLEQTMLSSLALVKHISIIERVESDNEPTTDKKSCQSLQSNHKNEHNISILLPKEDNKPMNSNSQPKSCDNFVNMLQNISKQIKHLSSKQETLKRYEKKLSDFKGGKEVFSSYLRMDCPKELIETPIDYDESSFSSLSSLSSPVINKMNTSEFLELPTSMPSSCPSYKKGCLAYVTLVDSLRVAICALNLGCSLRKTGTLARIVVIVTYDIPHSVRLALRKVFDSLIFIMKRNPVSCRSLLKILCWKLTDYTKCVFIDADCQVIANVDELFQYEELSAIPSKSDCHKFCSAVFVFRPSFETFQGLNEISTKINETKSDLVNAYFTNWYSRGKSNRLSYIYGLSPFHDLCILNEYGKDGKIMNFVGSLFSDSNDDYEKIEVEEVNTFIYRLSIMMPFIQKWIEVFLEDVQPMFYKEDNNHHKEKLIIM